MDWKSARARLNATAVEAAAAWVRENCSSGDFGNLYQRTKCRAPMHRYVTFRGQRLPAKAFGYLALRYGGWDQKEDYRPTVNEVVGPLRKLGVHDAARGVE
jgi:hypothetical protein